MSNSGSAGHHVESGYQSGLDNLCTTFGAMKSPSQETSNSEGAFVTPASRRVTFDESLPLLLECDSDDGWETEPEFSDDEDDEDYYPLIDPDSIRDSSDSETSDSEHESKDSESEADSEYEVEGGDQSDIV